MAGVLKKGEPLFPEKISIFAPEVDRLYYEGSLMLLDRPSVAVVGSRRCSAYGKNISGEIGRKLGKAGAAVISGLARGIDTEGHVGAVNTVGGTVAVVAGGTDQFYPAENRELQKKISCSGLVLSLRPPGYRCKPYDFPIRNRIISALADSVVIVEASSRSGALITAECAMEQGKNVYALPGNITSIYSFGTNTLIKEGAVPLVSVEDLILDMGLEPASASLETLGLGESEKAVVDALNEYGELTSDQLYHRTNIHPLDLNGILTVLEIKGVIFSAMGKFFLTGRL